MDGLVQTFPRSVRHRLVENLNLVLVGSWAGHALCDEKLPGWIHPSKRYLTGFLVPTNAPLEQRSDADEDDDLDAVPDPGGLPEPSAGERKAAKRSLFPSMGLDLPRSGETRTPLSRRFEGATTSTKSARRVERKRTSPPFGGGCLATERSKSPSRRPVSTSHVVERPIKTERLTDIQAGTRSVSMFLVTGASPTSTSRTSPMPSKPKSKCLAAQGFVPRPDPCSARAADWDADVADLHYADTPEYAAGHGVSAAWEVVLVDDAHHNRRMVDLLFFPR